MFFRVLFVSPEVPNGQIGRSFYSDELAIQTGTSTSQMGVERSDYQVLTAVVALRTICIDSF